MYDNLRAINERNQLQLAEAQKHTETQISMIELQQTVVKSFKMLVDYLDNKVSKTEVVNQLKTIGTPDVAYVVEAVNSLHDTLKTHENTDLSEVTGILREVLSEAKAIPKELPEEKEQKFVDYSDTLKSLQEAIKSVEEAVKSQQTTVEAPVVNVPETVVNVPETDLKPLESGLKAVEKAVKAILIPEVPKTDLSKVEKEQIKQTKLLKEIVDKPVGGGGGGGSSWTAINEDGVTQPLQLSSDKLKVLSTVNTDNATGDAFSRLRTSEPNYVFDANFQYDLQPLLFESVTSGSGATLTHDATNRNALMTFSDTPTGGASYLQTYEHFRYQAGRSQLVLTTFNFYEAVANVKKFIGYSDGNNGIQFELNGTTKQITLYSDTDKGDETVTQANWNIDRLDGTGVSGLTLDITKTHIFVIDFQWLGVGRIRCGFDIDGVIYHVHEFTHANKQQVAYMQTANLPLRAGMTCTGTVSTIMRFICCSVISEGGQEEVHGYNFTAEGTATAGSGTRTHALSIRPKTTFNSIANRSKMVIQSVDVIATGNAPIRWELCLGQAISGTTAFTDVNTDYSGTEYNTAGTISGTPTIVIAGGYASATATSKGSIESSIANRYPITLDVSGSQRSLGTLTVLVTGIGGSSTCRVSIDWKEIR